MNYFSEEAIATAAQHVHDILTQAILHTPSQKAIVVSDAQSPLACAMRDAYQRALPSATFINFDTTTPENILTTLNTLKPQDLVVLIQSTNFRLGAFRLRIELFKNDIKVIEHLHLARMEGMEGLYYIESLAYDAEYYRGVGHKLKKLIDAAKSGVVESGNGERLVFGSAFESAKLNIGDYSEIKNVGGQFPIGEVFTEAQDLEAVNGRVRIFIFGDTSFSVNKPDKPITLVINKGRVTEAIDSTPEFDKVLENIREDEGEVWLRELGFGMNRAFSADKTVADIGTYERMCGIHLSLGAKHGAYKKANIKRANIWHHVDVFAVTEAVYLDDQVVFREGAWRV